MSWVWSWPVFICPRSNIREGVCAGEWHVFGQKENQSSKEESGSHLPAGSLVRWEPSGQSPPGTPRTVNGLSATLPSDSRKLARPFLKKTPKSSPQVIVWGDYGRMDHKCFMGMAQILLEDLDLSATVSGWYKLFPTSSLADPSIGPLTRRLSQSSLESATSPSCP